MMSNDRSPKPPSKHIIDQIEALRPIVKFVGLFDKDIGEQFLEVERQFDDVKRAIANRDLFAKTYSPLGWVNYDRLSTEIVATVLDMSIEEGESELTTYHLDPDNLCFLGYRFNTTHFQPWRALYERAVERAGAIDYLSSVPLVLAIVDGICTTAVGKYPFSGGADRPVFDSQTSGPGGLSEGFALLGSTRGKLNAEPISIPFRHGIVHGLNPNYGHPIVAAKAFNLLQGTVDYFDRRRNEAQRFAKAVEDQKPVDILELVRSLQKNVEIQRAIDAWRARPVIKGILLASSDKPKNLPPDSPEALSAEYLKWLVIRNYGALAKATVDYPNRPIGYRAGRLREELKDLSVTRWEITGIEDTTAAMSLVTIKLEGRINGKAWNSEHILRLMFSDENYEMMVRGQKGGAWTVMRDFLTDLWLAAARSARGDA